MAQNIIIRQPEGTETAAKEPAAIESASTESTNGSGARQTLGILQMLDVRDIQQHVTIVGWLLILGHLLFLLIGAFVFFILTSIGVVSGDSQAMAILSMVGTAIGSLLALLALPGLIAGIGVLKRREWGRYLALVVAILGLVNFPLGTIIGLYTSWVLLQAAIPTYFARAADVDEPTAV